MKKSTKVEHGFKVTSDGRLIIKDEEEDVKNKGRLDLVVFALPFIQSEFALLAKYVNI